MRLKIGAAKLGRGDVLHPWRTPVQVQPVDVAQAPVRARGPAAREGGAPVRRGDV